MSDKISVIIPAYNAEKYLQDCIYSVTNQTYDNVEIIVINDGSTDGTQGLLEVYTAKDPRIILKTTSNHGQGHARNEGMRLSSGEYILFLDADDTLEETALETAIKRIKKDNSDFALFFYKYFNKNGKYSFKKTEPYFGKRIVEGDSRFELLDSKAYYSVTRLYRKKFLLENNINFEEGHIYEDNPFVLKTVLYASKISLIHSPLYNVRVNLGSSTRANLDTDKHYKDYIQATKKCVVTLNEFGYSDSEKIAQAKYYYARYAVRKFLEYYYRRVPRVCRKNFATDFVFLMSQLEPYDVLRPNDKLLSLCSDRNIFSRQNVLLFRLITFYMKVVRPKKKYLKKKIVKNIRLFEVSKQINDFEEKTSPNLVLFMGFDFRYTGNSRYLFEEMVAQNTQNLVLKFATRNNLVSDEYRVSPESEEFYSVFNKASIVIFESWIPKHFKKKEDAIWIQLWHGSPIKRMLFDSEEKEIFELNHTSKNRHYEDIQKWDLFFVDDRDFIKYFKSAFLLDNEKIVVGTYPRVRFLEQYVNNVWWKNKIKEKYNINKTARIILYCPTWRDYNYGVSEDDFDTSYQLDVPLFQEKLGDCFQVISKDHVYLHSDASKVKSLPDAETQELLLIADLVVSDYSSIIFDAMSINIPVLLYCNDFDRFESSRGVYPEVWSLIDERVETSLDGLARRILKMEAEGLLDMEKYPTRKDQSDRSKAAETLIKLAEGAERAAYKVIHFHANCDIDDQKAVKAIVSNIGKNRGSHIIAVLHDFESEFVSLLETVYLHNEKIVVVSSESQLAADLLTSIVIADEIDVNLSEIKKEI